jgi:putative ABC transport system ATP-binding protein
MSDPLILVHQLRKVYRIGKIQVEALRGVDLEILSGEFVSIVGPSGSGKSTLFHVVGGLTAATTGLVKVGGQDLAKLTEEGRTRLRRHVVSFVFQKFNLLPNLSAGQNIRLAQYLGRKGRVRDPDFDEQLEMLGIAKRLSHKPSELSGGEQQRVAIARAIVNRPQIILADEPTGNLDSVNASKVLQILKDLNKRLGQTILMITHNDEAAAYADRVIRMHDGRIV